MNQINAVFNTARSHGRAALIGYLPAGYPTPEAFCDLVQTAFEAGLDILEVGMPDENPFLDGQVIREANMAVVRSGLNTDQALEISAQALQQAGGCGLVMIYANKAAAYGWKKLVDKLDQLGYSAILPVGASPEQCQALAVQTLDSDLALIGFAQSSASIDQIKVLVSNARGFLYVQGNSGITGQQLNINAEMQIRVQAVAQLARAAGLPVALGFGVRTAQDVEIVRALGVDGVIVGTAFVEAAGQGLPIFKEYVQQLVRAAGKVQEVA